MQKYWRNWRCKVRITLEVYSITRFVDMFQSMSLFIKLKWPRPRPIYVYVWGSATFYKGHMTQAMPLFWIFICRFWRNCPRAPVGQIEVCSYTRFGDMFEGVPNFIGATWPWPPLPVGKIFGGYVRTVAGNMCVKFEVRSFNLARSTCHMHCSARVYGQKLYCACAVSRDLGVGGKK